LKGVNKKISAVKKTTLYSLIDSVQEAGSKDVLFHFLPIN